MVRKFPSELYGGAKGYPVGLSAKSVGEPDAGNPHVRFDERGRETERPLGPPPRSPSTLLKIKAVILQARVEYRADADNKSI